VTGVLLVDDHAMFREGMLLTIAKADPVLTVYDVANGNAALAAVREHADISCVIMDYYLPDIGGAALLRGLRQLRPGVRILVLSASEDPDDRDNALAAGAHAFVHKSADSQTLVNALACVRSGTPWQEGGIAAAYPRMAHAVQADEATLLSTLTPRQGEVLRLVCNGLRNREIAEHLGMTERTVKAHVSAVLTALGALNRTQATLIARRGGLFGKPQ
jgi:DNA-binding NarL/FixJ family response regulator